MTDSDSNGKTFKVHQANRTLQARIGTGTLDEKAVERRLQQLRTIQGMKQDQGDDKSVEPEAPQESP